MLYKVILCNTLGVKFLKNLVKIKARFKTFSQFYLTMLNKLESIKNWFFELIEDALGEKTMKKYKDEIDKKNKTSEKDD